MSKLTKRVLSLALACIFALPAFGSIYAEEKEEYLSKAKNLLSALDIVDDDSDAIVTRERFADIFVRANNMYDPGYSSSNPFSDTEGSEYAPSIELMRDHGIINGVGDNMYAPTENMRTNDIAKLYVTALGLDIYVETTGKNYVQTAYAFDLFDGVVVSEYITMDNLIRMTYNFLKAPVGVHNFTEETSYSIDTDSSILSKKFNITKVIGQVTQNDLSGIWSSSGAPEGHVVIETKDGAFTILEGDSGIGAMLGRTLEIYIEDKENDYVVVCYDRLKNEQSEIIDIDNIDFTKTNNSVIYYYRDGRSSLSSEKLAGFPSFIINGVYYDIGAFDITTLESYSGEIELISSNNSDYDIVVVDAYTNYFVKNVEHYDGAMYIYDSGTNEPLVLDAEQYERLDIFYPNGAAASPYEIQAGMLISVAKSFGTQKYVRGYISDTVYTGNVVKYEDADDIIVMSDGTEYDVSPSLTSVSVSMTADATLYVDIFGDIAWIEYDKTAVYSYAYLREIRNDPDAERVKIKVVIESGKFTTMYLAEKTRIDGITYKDTDRQVQELMSVQKFDNIAAGEYPFRYRLNEEGEIREIDTPRVRSGYEDEDSFRQTTSGSNVICSNDKILGKLTPLSSSTVMFLIPEASATEERDNAKFYKVGNNSLLNTGGSNTYTAFKVDDKSMYADLVIRTQSNIGSGLSHDNKLFLVNKIRDTYHEKSGEIRTKVSGLEAGVEKEYFLHEQFDASAIDGIEQGDVVRFSITDNEITAMDKVFLYNDDVSTNTGKYYLPSGGQKASSLSQIGTSYYYSGYVMVREGKLIEILPFDLEASGQSTGVEVPNYPDWNIKTRRVFQAPTKISVYDPSLGTKDAVYVGDLEDIPSYEDGRNYAKVIVRYRSRSAQEMIVLKDQSLFR